MFEHYRDADELQDIEADAAEAIYHLEEAQERVKSLGRHIEIDDGALGDLLHECKEALNAAGERLQEIAEREYQALRMAYWREAI